MSLTPEQKELGRRNFMRALAGTPALAALGAAAVTKGPVKGGPVRLGYVGLGAQGRVLLENTDPRYAQVVALCDINPAHLTKADESMAKAGLAPVPHHSDWKEMIQKEKLEGVVLAPPLFMHADLAVGCMEAGLHSAGVWPDEPFAHLHGRGLARAVGAQQRKHFGALDIEVEVGHRGRRPVPFTHPAQSHGDWSGRSHGDSAYAPGTGLVVGAGDIGLGTSGSAASSLPVTGCGTLRHGNIE